MSSPCRNVAPLVATYLDGELAPSQLVEVETHAMACGACRERLALDRAVRTAVRHAVAREGASAELRARVAGSMAAERRRLEHVAALAPRLVPLRQVAPFAVAAAFALFAGWQSHREASGDAAPAARAAQTRAAQAAMDSDAVLDQFVDWHARPLPPEVTRPEDLTGFDPYVGVPVRPPKLAFYGAHLLGGRILPVREQEHAAAMLQYTMQSGHRVSVYVYDPKRLRLSSHLRPRIVGLDDQPEVYAGRVRGYSVAAAVRRDVGYAVATDLDEDESVELAMAAVP